MIITFMKGFWHEALKVDGRVQRLVRRLLFDFGNVPFQEHSVSQSEQILMRQR
jgi:hypothetical protein